MFSKPLSFVSKSVLKTFRQTARQSKSKQSQFGYNTLEARQLLAAIAWSSGDTTQDNDVSINGSLVFAINATTGTGIQTSVNGVGFVASNREDAGTVAQAQSPGNESIDVFNESIDAFTIGNDNANAFENGGLGNVGEIIRGGWWGGTTGNSNATATVTLTGLTVGDIYEVQVFSNDARSSRNSSFISRLDDGNGGTGVDLALNNQPLGGSAGDFGIGTFTADSSTQSFTVTGLLNGNLNGGRAQVNAIQLRSLEPVELLPGAAPFVNEFSASNSSSLDDDNGNSTDWIEIYNGGEDSVDLGGYSLTDDPTDITKYVIPDNTNLAGGQYLIIFAGDDADPSTGTDLYTSFGLASGGDYVGFYDPSGDLVNEFGAGGADYPQQFTDVSYGVEATSTIDIPDAEDLGNFPTASSITINTEGSDFDTELGLFDQNGTLLAANDDALGPDGLQSQINTGTLADGTYYIAVGGFDSSFASGFSASSGSNAGNFNLDVFDASFSNTALISEALASNEIKFFSFTVGTATAPGVSFFATPTPGSANISPVDGVINALPTVSVKRGFYDAAFTVDVTSQTVGATLIYTTDGSEPSFTNGTQVAPANASSFATASILISETTSLRTAVFKTGFLTEAATTHTYVFLNDVINSSVLDPEITADYTPEELRAGLLDIPTLSFNYETEITDSFLPEQAASIEWLAPDGSEGFQIDAGISGFGGFFTNFQKRIFESSSVASTVLRSSSFRCSRASTTAFLLPNLLTV